MKYKTQVTETKDIEVEVNPAVLLETLLKDKLKLIPIETKYTYSYVYINTIFELIEVQVKEGYGHGHYEQDDKLYEKDITLEVDSALLDTIIAYKKVLMDLQEGKNCNE